MSIVGTPKIGFEEIQRGALRLLFAEVNDAIAEVSTDMATDDQLLALEMGQTYVPTTVELIDPKNFYEGHRPSLIDAAASRYPNCSVWALRAAPSVDSGSFDQVDINVISLFIEIMVKDLESEENVNRRLSRTVEAVHAVIAKDPTLGGVVSGLNTDPIIELADVFTRKDRGGSDTGQGARAAYGSTWFWQGARLTYAVRKETGMSSAGSFFRSAGIDQG
jgi:hypothetical protein